MDVETIRCVRCAAPLAPADARCAACGEAVAPVQRVVLLSQRAEAFAEEGLFAQAARSAETLLALPLEPDEEKLWWRKLAVWLQRGGQPGALDAAENALLRSVRVDDADDLGHQLWIDLLQRRGRLDEARRDYKARLSLKPDDAVAARHLASLRLMEDLKLAAPPKLNIEEAKQGLLMKAIWPTPYKMLAAGIGLVSCLYMLIAVWLGSSGLPALPDGAESMGAIVKLADDPALNAAQVLLYSAYLFWGFRERRGA